MKVSDILQVDRDNVGHGKLSEYDQWMVLLEMSQMILDESIPDTDLRRKVFERIPRELLLRAVGRDKSEPDRVK